MRTMLAIFSACACALAGCSTNTATPRADPGGDEEAVAARSEASLLRDRTPVSAPSATLTVYGLSCPLCANSSDQQLKKIEGVRDVAIDLGEGKIRVGIAPGATPTKARFARAIKDAGFTLVKVETP